MKFKKCLLPVAMLASFTLAGCQSNADDHAADVGNDSNLLIVFYVQIMPDDFVMQLHRF